MEDDRDLGYFIHLAAATGARRGELCALRWSDIDFEAKTLTISRSIVEAAHSALVEKDTKTHGSRRIALDDGTVIALLEHRVDREAAATAADATYTRHSYLFSRSVDGSKPWPPNDVTKAFVRVRDRCGVGNRLHDLRHFAATRLLAAGVSVRTVSGRLGHANAATTLGVYAHFLEASDRDAAATLGALLAQGQPQ